MIRDLRVGPSAASRLPGDEPRVITAAEIADVFVEPRGPGRWVVHGADGTDTWAATGPPRVDSDGIATIEVVVDGWRFELDVADAARAALRLRATRVLDAETTSGPLEIRAIIPGRVAAVRVVAGDAVEAGQGLLVVEAMKMQNEIRAPRTGVVERVAVASGQAIDNGDVLVVLR